jgi:hypothetical protein
MKTYTVKELHDVLEKAIENGKGDLILLVPNDDEDIDAEYATLGKISFDDELAEYAYFDSNCGEEEEEFWRDKE